MPASDEASLFPPEISRYLPGLYMMKFGNKEMSLDMNKNSRFASYRNIILFTLLTALMLYFAQLHSEYPENIEVMEA